MDTAQLRIGWALGELAAANHDCPAETVGKIIILFDTAKLLAMNYRIFVLIVVNL